MLRSQAVDENWGWSARIVTTSLRSSEQLGAHADKSHGFLAQRHPVQATKVQQSFYKAALSLTPWWLGCWIARTRPMIRRLNDNNWNRSDPAVLLFGSLLNSRNHRNHFLLDCFVHRMIILAIIYQHDIITRNQQNSVWRFFLFPWMVHWIMVNYTANVYTYPWSVGELVSDCHLRILTQRMTFETWDFSDILSEWWLDKKTKRQKDNDQKERLISMSGHFWTLEKITIYISLYV